MSELLDFLTNVFGNSSGTAKSDLNHPLNIMAGNGLQSLAKSGMNRPQGNPTLPPLPPPMPAPPPLQPPPLEQDPVTVRGDPWKPKKGTVLGAIADAIIMHNGDRPAFSDARDKANLSSAMEGFTSDPERAIKRIRQLDPDSAWKMYNTWQDNVRADGVAKRQEDVASIKYMSRFGDMLNGISRSDNPTQRYKDQYPLLKAYADKYHLPMDGLLPDYDKGAVDTYIAGNVDVEDQLKLEALNQYRSQSLGIRQQQVDNTEQYRGRRLDQIDTAEGGRNARADTRERGVQGRADQKNAGPRMVATPHGAMQLDKSGNFGRIGDQEWQKTGKGQWKRIK